MCVGRITGQQWEGGLGARSMWEVGRPVRGAVAVICVRSFPGKGWAKLIDSEDTVVVELTQLVSKPKVKAERSWRRHRVFR